MNGMILRASISDGLIVPPNVVGHFPPFALAVALARLLVKIESIVTATEFADGAYVVSSTLYDGFKLTYNAMEHVLREVLRGKGGNGEEFMYILRRTVVLVGR